MVSFGVLERWRELVQNNKYMLPGDLGVIAGCISISAAWHDSSSGRKLQSIPSLNAPTPSVSNAYGQQYSEVQYDTTIE